MKMSSSTRLFAHVAALLLIVVPVLAAEGTGSIEGRVSNAISGLGLENARVETATGQLVQTNAIGEFRLLGVPAGEVQLSVSFLGMQPSTRKLTLATGGRERLNIELQRIGTGDDKDVIKLERFDVSASREMTAQAIALNEQRAAPNLKSVVALDQYGNQGDESIGEFMHFLPGVGVTADSDDGPIAVSLRGFPSNYSNISVNGGSAGAGRNNSRSANLADVPFLNASRVEITKVPTPDMPASGLGGSINLVLKNGFELGKPAFNYRLTALTHSKNGTSFRWPKGQTKDISPSFTVPSASLSYQGAITPRVAVTAAISNTWRFKPAEDGDHSRDLQPTWNRVTNVQTASAWQALPALYQTYNAQLGFDFKLTPKDILSIGGQVKYHRFDLARSRLAVNYGAGATGDANHTQGAATGVGSVGGAGSGWFSRFNEQLHLNLGYTHQGDVWKFEFNADYSDRAYFEDSSRNGYFDAVDVQITNLVIRGDDIPLLGIPKRYTVRTRTGDPVDIFNGENYTINSVTDRHLVSRVELPSLRSSISRSFDVTFPLALKAGIAADQQRRDRRLYNWSWNFRPNGATDAAQRRAGLFDVFDEEFLRESAANIYGNRLREISHKKVYELYRKNPSWFVLDEAAAHQNLVTGSSEFKETITAAYLRADAKLLRNRLWLTAGVRFERTDVTGRGPLNDIARQYQRNSDGSIKRDAAGFPILKTTDNLELRKLRFVERGASAESDYQNFYPSLNSSYRVGDAFVLRAAYARTIGRPNTSTVTPGTTITDPENPNPTITVNNPGLLPWTGDNYDLTLETYEVKGGSGSVGLFRKDIKDFFGGIRTAASDELLAKYSLATDGTYQGYQIATLANVGDARVTGYEMSYRQNLVFLPGILKSFQLYGNFTKITPQGNRSADFSGFIPKSMSAGVNFIRPNYFIKLSYIHQPSFKRASVAQSTTELADTYQINPDYTRWGLNGEYSFSKRYTVFASASDLGRRTTGTLTAAPSTPRYATSVRNIVLGYYIVFGIKGTF
jgi:TonB-dependent receptor